MEAPRPGGAKLRLNLKKPAQPAPGPEERWPILVVDDDPQIHAMTDVVLRDFVFHGRGFEIIPATSAAAARAILAERRDIPVMLLDVVMETDDAGLALARHVRETLGDHRLRIILRTGQPGEAPERDVMVTYDINDYRAKTELTAQKLFTAIVGALRSWQHIEAVERMNATLEERVAQRTRELAEARRFSESLIELLPSPVWYKDSSGSCRLSNRAFREFFPQSGPSGEFAEREAETDPRILSGAATRISFEATLSASDGSARTLVVAKAPMLSETGAAEGIINVATDISDRKALERELHRLATADPLTGIANRRHFLAIATQEMERSIRYHHPLSAIMLDIDHFKQINDSWGHAAGDDVLVGIVAACAATLRDVDLLGRLGGEEFAVLLPETGHDGALEVAERLRRAVAAVLFPIGGGTVNVTISLGIAEREECDATIAHLLARADRALYRAKQGGRDRAEG